MHLCPSLQEVDGSALGAEPTILGRGRRPVGGACCPGSRARGRTGLEAWGSESSSRGQAKAGPWASRSGKRGGDGAGPR